MFQEELGLEKTKRKKEKQKPLTSYFENIFNIPKEMNLVITY